MKQFFILGLHVSTRQSAHVMHYRRGLLNISAPTPPMMAIQVIRITRKRGWLKARYPVVIPLALVINFPSVSYCHHREAVCRFRVLSNIFPRNLLFSGHWFLRNLPCSKIKWRGLLVEKYSAWNGNLSYPTDIQVYRRQKKSNRPSRD